ncbi:hypothetical protein, partial [Roseiconus lacunae]
VTSNLGIAAMPRGDALLSTVCFFAILASSVFLNFDGYHLHVRSPWGDYGDAFAEPPAINWVHGWPIGCLVRASIFDPSIGKGVLVPTVPTSPGFYSRWPIDNAPVYATDNRAAIFNVIFCVAITLSGFFSTLHFTRRSGSRLRFNLRSMLWLVSVSAALFLVADWIIAFRSIFELVSCMCALIGIVALCYMVALGAAVTRRFIVTSWHK